MKRGYLLIITLSQVPLSFAFFQVIFTKSFDLFLTFFTFFSEINVISFSSFQTVASCWRTRRWIRTQSSTATTVSASWWATREPNSCGVRPPQSSCMGPSPRSRPCTTYGGPWLHVPKDRSRYCTIGKMVRQVLLQSLLKVHFPPQKSVHFSYIILKHTYNIYIKTHIHT